MYRHFLIRITILLMVTEIHGQWEILNQGISVTPNTIDFVNENVGWIAGDNVLLKTEDAGISWQSTPVEENFSLHSCDFINESSGWAIGWSKILKTTDGGHNWSISKQMPNHFVLESLHVLNDSTVYVIGNDRSNNDFDRGFVWKTSDGGSTWMDISPDLVSKIPNNIWFINSDIGILMCDRYIFRTYDGGVSWEQISGLFKFTKIYDLQFSGDSTAFFLAEKDYNDREEYFFCASSDTLKTWMIKTQRAAPIQTYFALDENSIFALMEDSICRYLMKSTDAGTNWEQICSLTDNAIYSKLYMNRNGLSFLLGKIDAGLFYWGDAFWTSTDGGYSWSLAKFNYRLQDVCFIDKYTGYIAGINSGGIASHVWSVGKLFKTENRGETWNIVSGLPRAFLSSCQFITKEVGFTRCSSGIFKTNDGGDSWHSIFNTENDSLLSRFEIGNVFFLDEFVGWAVGHFQTEDSSGAFILSTVDGGENWNIVFTHRDTETEEFSFNSINAIDNTVWAVGEYGLMAKFMGKNHWQLRTSVTDLPLTDVFFSDENHGWIAGGYFHGSNDYQLILLKTSNGGESWGIKQALMYKYKINDMYFADSLHGWVVGTDTSWSGMILETFDGGDTWTTKVEGLSARLNALHFKDSYGWAVGRNGLILRYDGITWIEDKPITNNDPKRYKLYQNYPNPFNPKTVISWQVGATSTSPVHVELSVYNLLGQKVATLVNSKQKAGFYSVEWDASGFASGIYYYRLLAGEYVAVKKLVLLR